MSEILNFLREILTLVAVYEYNLNEDGSDQPTVFVEGVHLHFVISPFIVY